jgi:predicted dithiol-disulfide oxidoreductase (DUF899 family)
MFGPSYEAGCPVCSSIADNLDPNAVHLAAQDVTVVLSSRAPLEKHQAYKQRMCWDNLDWVSTVGDDFHHDLGFQHTEEELRPFLEGEIPPTVVQNTRVCGTDVAGYVSEGPGLSVYFNSDGIVYRTYVTTHGVSSRRWATTDYSTARRWVATRATRGRYGCGGTMNTISSDVSASRRLSHYIV